MNKGIFTVDDIHRLRIENADRRSKMPPEEAQRDFNERVERGRRAIKEIRQVKSVNIRT